MNPGWLTIWGATIPGNAPEIPPAQSTVHVETGSVATGAPPPATARRPGGLRESRLRTPRSLSKVTRSGAANRVTAQTAEERAHCS